MKSRIQFTPSLTVAIVCALAWFALWLTVFRPVPATPAQPGHHPQLTLHPGNDDALRALQTPTRFARPSEEGFSGVFPAKEVDVPMTLEHPHQPETYLPRPESAAAEHDKTKLIEAIPLPESELPAPGAARMAVARSPERIELFFSPELQARAVETDPLKKIETVSAASMRIHLTVRSDGTVAQTFFETPVNQPALLSAVRRIRFSPAPEETTGWLDIRFTPPAGETN